jgi:hypothetical protein
MDRVQKLKCDAPSSERFSCPPCCLFNDGFSIEMMRSKSVRYSSKLDGQDSVPGRARVFRSPQCLLDRLWVPPGLQRVPGGVPGGKATGA